MTPRTLAEIVEEGKRLERESAAVKFDEDAYLHDVCTQKLAAFARNNLPRLLAVAEAAVEMRAAEMGSDPEPYAVGPLVIHKHGCAGVGASGAGGGKCNCGGAAIADRIAASRAAFDAAASGEEKKR